MKSYITTKIITLLILAFLSIVPLSSKALTGILCSASPSTATLGEYVEWEVTPPVGGARGSPWTFVYNWTWSDGRNSTQEDPRRQHNSSGSIEGTVLVTASDESSGECSYTIVVSNQCTDGIDNDNDGDVDTADFGCNADNSEADPILQGSCSAVPPTPTVGDVVTWSVNASGGRGSNTIQYEWSGALGDDQFNHTNTSFQTTYNNSGDKLVNVRLKTDIGDALDVIKDCRVCVKNEDGSGCTTTGGGGYNTGGGTGAEGVLRNPLGDDTITTFLSKVLAALVELLIPLIILFYIIAGLMFITARGKPEKLALARTAFLYTTIGAAVILGAWVLAEIIDSTITAIQG